MNESSPSRENETRSAEGAPRHLAFLDRFEALLGSLDEADIRVPEDSALIGLARDLVPKVSRLVERGVRLLEKVEEHYQPGHHVEERIDPDADSLAAIGLTIASEFAARDLTDVCFFARTDLQSAHKGLVDSATQGHGPVALASNCESGLRRLRKALVSVESAICEYEDLPVPDRHWYDVEVSLQIRRLYWNLRRETEGADPGNEEALEKRLRGILYRILAFRELSVYPFLRVDDRVYLRQLLKRILTWLNADERHTRDGYRLWLDLSSFAEILFQVSHRQELRSHDRRKLEKVETRLFRGQLRPERVPESLLGELGRLVGLDDELDELILAGERTSAADWKPTIERLLAQLSPRRG